MCSESHLAVRINDTYILGEILKAVDTPITIVTDMLVVNRYSASSLQ